jgi:hypothetical protein
MSGGSDSAAKQAQANEDAKNASIQQATSQIGSIFDSPARKQQYTDLGNATTAYYTDQLNRQQDVTNRNLKFAQARGGQTGGSVAADQATTSGKDYLAGVLKARNLGSAASANLQGQDAQEQANLIAAAQGGLSATDAASQASSAMRGSLQSAQATSTANAFGDAFGDVGQIYQKSQDAAQLRNGMLYSYNTVYQPGFGYGGSTGGTGEGR